VLHATADIGLDFLAFPRGRDWRGRVNPFASLGDTVDPPYGSISFLIERDLPSLYHGSSVSGHDMIELIHPHMR
jgi:hypothetical protein